MEGVGEGGRGVMQLQLSNVVRVMQRIVFVWLDGEGEISSLTTPCEVRKKKLGEL